MSLHFAIYASPGGSLYADYSARIQGAIVASNNRGFAECSGFIPMGLDEAFRLYDRPGLPHVVFSDPASGAQYEGRLEDVNIVSGGVTVRAFGYSRSLTDAPYTALWSTTDVTAWRPIRTSEVSNRVPELYTMDTNNRVQIALTKNTVYGNVADAGSMVFQKPDGSSRQIVGMSFDLVISLPTNWLFEVYTWQNGYTGIATQYTYTGNTAIETLNRFMTFSGADYIELAIYNNTGGNYTNTNETNRWKATLTNVRLVSATTNMVNTTTTAAVSAGSGVSVPVVTSARMYVGQRLHMGIPAALGFAATVLTIPDSTHFTADLSAAMASGGNVQALVIYADEIAKDLRASVSTLNATQLAASDALIQSPSLDLLDEVYEDRYGADILDYLSRLGDTQTPPRQWEWGVASGRLLYFRPQNSASRTWYIDVSDLDIQRSLDALGNSVYATYQEAGGRTLRTAVSSDATSVARYGLTRRKQIGAQSTSSTQANAQRDAALNDSKDPKPRSGLTITQVYDANGSRWPLYFVRAGDTMIIRNLPPTLSVSIDRVRVFRLTRTEYAFDSDTLTLEPELPLPSLDALLSLAVPPTWVTAPWWVQIQR